jgi:hypothetical protein
LDPRTLLGALRAGGVPNDKGLPTGPNPPPASDAKYNGRPVDLQQLPDGSMLVSDDFGGQASAAAPRPLLLTLMIG